MLTKRKAGIVLILILGASTVYSQIEFEKGYAIDKDNQRIECLIKNQDWRNSPKKIFYKINSTDSVRSGTASSLKEFGVDGFSKYISVHVKIDRSPTELSELTEKRDPLWSDEKLFLKILVRGKASLFGYTDGNLTRFFYSVDSSAIKQLVFKEYFQTNKMVGTNRTFQQQLWLDVRCDDTRELQLKGLGYSDTELIKYFLRYNQCHGGSVEQEATDKKKRDAFDLKLAPGLNYSSLSIENEMANINEDFENKVSARLGLEFEFFLPFNKNKWSILFEPTFQSYTSEVELYSIDYKFIDFPIGLRYYFFLRGDSRIFVNLHLIPKYTAELETTFDRDNSLTLDISTRECFALGAGLQLNRFSGEIRYYGKLDILSHVNINSDLSRIAFIVGYKILKVKK